MSGLFYPYGVPDPDTLDDEFMNAPDENIPAAAAQLLMGIANSKQMPTKLNKTKISGGDVVGLGLKGTENLLSDLQRSAEFEGQLQAEAARQQQRQIEGLNTRVFRARELEQRRRAENQRAQEQREFQLQRDADRRAYESLEADKQRQFLGGQRSEEYDFRSGESQAERDFRMQMEAEQRAYEERRRQEELQRGGADYFPGIGAYGTRFNAETGQYEGYPVPGIPPVQQEPPPAPEFEVMEDQAGRKWYVDPTGQQPARPVVTENQGQQLQGAPPRTGGGSREDIIFQQANELLRAGASNAEEAFMKASQLYDMVYGGQPAAPQQPGVPDVTVPPEMIARPSALPPRIQRQDGSIYELGPDGNYYPVRAQ
jgi:hypothetical protein